MKSNKLIDNIFFFFIIFFLASVVGYIYEVIYCIVDDHELVNRGFLYGPYLPVYGFGALAMILTLKKFTKHPVALYFMAIIVTGITEYIAGLFLDKVFHERLWDYTGLLLNINGYVCLRSVLSFGVGALLLFYFADPLIVKKILPIREKYKKIIIILVTVTITIDFIFTLIFKYVL